jgi:hypothetical protein
MTTSRTDGADTPARMLQCVMTPEDRALTVRSGIDVDDTVLSGPTMPSGTSVSDAADRHRRICGGRRREHEQRAGNDDRPPHRE